MGSSVLTIVLFWLALAVVMVLNGVVGKALWEPRLGEYGNHVVKSLLGVLADGLRRRRHRRGSRMRPRVAGDDRGL